jgi:hypothetical protein
VDREAVLWGAHQPALFGELHKVEKDGWLLGGAPSPDDSRSCRSAPSCLGRGNDGGKKIEGIKIHLVVDKYGFPLAIAVSPANVHDIRGIVPVLDLLAGRSWGTALGDVGHRGHRLSKAGQALSFNLEPSAGGDGKTFIPDGIRWVVEHSSCMSHYRRLTALSNGPRSTSTPSFRSPSSPSSLAASGAPYD